jgi:hypothetical protein
MPMIRSLGRRTDIARPKSGRSKTNQQIAAPALRRKCPWELPAATRSGPPDAWQESGIAIVHQRCWFWDRALKRLHQLSNKVGEEERQRIVAMLAKKVPMPTREEYEFCHRSMRENYGVGGPLPEHPLYELPANFLDTLDHSKRITLPRLPPRSR